MMQSISMRIFGKVQGVFYRQGTKEQADRLGLKGFVQNEADGSVYVEVEGSKDIVERFIAWCHQGPPRATVTKMETKEMSCKGFATFEIRK